jgi:hypothetical protein
LSSNFKKHLKDTGVLDKYQSAYRAGHSTESAILKIKADVDEILDSGDAVLLVSLDMSAAFDTVDHNVLLSRLEEYAGVKGSALQWMRSYLENRSQAVVIDGVVSKQYPLQIGVPQGSVLGPVLFLVYILPLQHILEKHRKLRHGYADDLQTYCPLKIKKRQELQQALQSMNECLAEVRVWMLTNKLKINDAKTEAIVFASKHNMKMVSELDISVTVGGEIIKPAITLKALGALMDSEMSMHDQISSVVRSCYHHLRQIRRIRHHLDVTTCKTVVQATITSRLDYHNALLAGVTSKEQHRLQLVQNHAARLITGVRKHDHISPVLKQLHWLPLQQRIQFKVLSFVYKAVHDPNAPLYLQDSVSVYQPSRCLRSSDDNLKLCEKRVKTVYGERSFSKYGPVLWNKLPISLRSKPTIQSFKKGLKTFLFYEAHP